MQLRSAGIVASIVGLSLFAGCYEGGARSLAERVAERPQRRGEARGQGELVLAAALRDVDVAADDAVSHDHARPREVEVRPLQREHLPASQAGVQAEKEHQHVRADTQSPAQVLDLIERLGKNPLVGPMFLASVNRCSPTPRAARLRVGAMGDRGGAPSSGACWSVGLAATSDAARSVPTIAGGPRKR